MAETKIIALYLDARQRGYRARSAHPTIDLPFPDGFENRMALVQTTNKQ
jgi:hypothetical protein